MTDWPVWHWHIENSSICSLRCPRCPRAEIPDSLVQTSLGVDFFKRNFDMDMLANVWQISFCGDDGDPIYGKEFLETIEYLKSAKPKLSLRIVTNGSHRPAAWWKRLSAALNRYDEIHFSIDGWDQITNSRYRVNCDWDSIMEGVKILRENSDVLMTWAAIVFSFNHAKMNYMSYLAEVAGFDRFQMTLSTKFGTVYENYLTDGVDTLEPPPEYIPSGHRFKRTVLKLTDRTQADNGKNLLNDNIWEHTDKTADIIPMCKIGNKGLYISSQGFFYPCCWMANRYNHTRWQQFRTDAYDLNKRTISEVLADPQWGDFFQNLHNHSECVNKCSAHNYSKDYATSW
jgi:MoaA/NifB/PqqE/SkfB family radical SAM enzyme